MENYPEASRQSQALFQRLEAFTLPLLRRLDAEIDKHVVDFESIEMKYKMNDFK